MFLSWLVSLGFVVVAFLSRALEQAVDPFLFLRWVEEGAASSQLADWVGSKLLSQAVVGPPTNQLLTTLRLSSLGFLRRAESPTSGPTAIFLILRSEWPYRLFLNYA